MPASASLAFKGLGEIAWLTSGVCPCSSRAPRSGHGSSSDPLASVLPGHGICIVCPAYTTHRAGARAGSPFPRFLSHSNQSPEGGVGSSIRAVSGENEAGELRVETTGVAGARRSRAERRSQAGWRSPVAGSRDRTVESTLVTKAADETRAAIFQRRDRHRMLDSGNVDRWFQPCWIDAAEVYDAVCQNIGEIY